MSNRRLLCQNFLAVSVTLMVALMAFSCNELWGDHPLGNNYSLSEGDKEEDRVIIYCPFKKLGICDSGIFVIPVYERHMDRNGTYAEYVLSAQSNEKWIIAKTLRRLENQENYWIIDKDFEVDHSDCSKTNCDSVIQAHVVGPLSPISFSKKIKMLKVELSF
jgi:hypothetical protein